MYGMIHRAARDMVLAQGGEAIWQRCLKESGLGRESFISARIYSDADTFSLIDAAARVLDMPAKEVLVAFGEYWVEFADRSHFSAQMQASGNDLITFLCNLNKMHDQLMVAMPGARLPTFALTRSDSEGIHVSYRSDRDGLEPFVAGLLKGLLKRFHLQGEVMREGLVAGGADFVIVLHASPPLAIEGPDLSLICPTFIRLDHELCLRDAGAAVLLRLPPAAIGSRFWDHFRSDRPFEPCEIAGTDEVVDFEIKVSKFPLRGLILKEPAGYLFFGRPDPIKIARCPDIRVTDYSKIDPGPAHGFELQLRAQMLAEIDELFADQLFLKEEAALAHAKAAAQQQFLANMSHEIRTPLSGVISLLEIVRNGDLNPDQAKLIETIDSSAQSLNRVLDDVLTYSSLQRGALSTLSEPNDPVDLIETSTRLFLGAAEYKGIKLRCFSDQAVSGSYNFDRLRVGQVIGNLISNSLKFTFEGEVTVYLHVTSVDPQNSMLRFRVVDTGMGISQDVRENLFQPFSQGDESILRRFGGTGLGLSIAKELAILMGGDLIYESIDGTGSIFELQLPVATPKPGAGDDRTLLSGVRVGICTSDPDEQRYITGYLAYAGASVMPVPFETMRTENNANLIDIILAPEYLSQSITDALESRNNAKQRIFGKMVVYADRDPAVDRQISNATIVTTSRSRSRILTAVADAIGRRSSELGRTKVVQMDERPTSHAARILVAEDHPVNREVLLRQLRTLGFIADYVNNGQEAAAALAASEYDLLLTDCHMPVMDGYELARQIRLLEPAGRRMPIIAVTANVLGGVREMCLSAGMDDYVTKPVSLEVLRERLDQWLPAAANGHANDAAS